MVSRILPLNRLRGVLFLSDKKLYFQSFQTIKGKQVKKFDIESFRKIYKKRFELQFLFISNYVKNILLIEYRHIGIELQL